MCQNGLSQLTMSFWNISNIAHFQRFYFFSSLKSKIANLESENELLRNQEAVVMQIATPERPLSQVKVQFFLGCVGGMSRRYTALIFLF